MPNVDIDLMNVQESVSRPVMMTVVKDLQHILGMENTQIIFPGDIGKAKQPNTTISSKPGTRDPKLSNVRHAYIEVVEKLNPEGISSHPGRLDEYSKIFEDPYLMFLMRPIYAFTDVEITFKYVTNSRVDALTWYNNAYTKAGMLRQNAHLHRLSYHYNIPYIAEKLFREIYRCREEQAGYGETLQEYFRKYASPNFTMVTDLVGKKEVLSVAETQSRVVGVLDVSGIPEKPTKNGDNVTWEAEINYKFTYEKPVSLNIVYPISVHNQLLPALYIQDTNQVGEGKDLDSVNMRFSDSHRALAHFEVPFLQDRYYDRYREVCIPSIDDAIMGYMPSRLSTVFTALCIIDPEQPDLYLNLRELDEYVLDDAILKFMEETEYPYLCKMFDSLLNISLYEGTNFKGSNSLYVDKDLNVRSKVPINIRNQCRIRLSMANDITIINPQAIVRIVRDPDALAAFVLYLQELYANRPTCVSPLVDKRISLEVFCRIYERYMRTNAYKEWLERNKDVGLYEKYRDGYNPTDYHPGSNDKEFLSYGTIKSKTNTSGIVSSSTKDYFSKKYITVKEMLRKFLLEYSAESNIMKTRMDMYIQAKHKGDK